MNRIVVATVTVVKRSTGYLCLHTVFFIYCCQEYPIHTRTALFNCDPQPPVTIESNQKWQVDCVFSSIITPTHVMYIYTSHFTPTGVTITNARRCIRRSAKDQHIQPSQHSSQRTPSPVGRKETRSRGLRRSRQRNHAFRRRNCSLFSRRMHGSSAEGRRRGTITKVYVPTRC